ncbi:MAG TPA: family 43 glycosylhydrolase [Pyrinomonadaceae bacterium]|nr:family 43 glycosylhydrolase [Pyrinomonadaceae bacterium]
MRDERSVEVRRTERSGGMRRAERSGGRPSPRVVAALALVLAASALVFTSASEAFAQRRATYSNPVEAGDFPDPSITRTGQDFYASATTSEWGPEFPILHSRDLVNWEIIGAVFQRRPEWATGSFWAPEISQYRGRFFVYYVGRKKGGPLCVAVATAARPQGPYADHGPLVCQDVGSIDPFPATDESGARYLLWKEDGNSVSKRTPIWAQRLSEDGTRLVGERRELIHNDQAWEKHPTLPFGNLVEGPSVVRRNGWFYLFYSGNFCCGRECDYALGVARSRRLLGPWEKNPRNPILAGNDAWKCPGHGTVIEDARGRYFLLYHAYQPKDFVYVGRQALLDEVIFGADGWPTINEGHGPSARAASPFGARETNARYSFFDDFNAPTLRPGWQWPQSNVPDFRVERGSLLLAPTVDAAADPTAAVLARTTTRGDYTATVALDPRSLKGKGTAGLSAYGDADNSLGIAVRAGGGVFLWRKEKDKPTQLTDQAEGAARGPVVYLRMSVREGHLYRFALSGDGRAWKDVGGELDGAYLPPWDRGVRVALVAGESTGWFKSLRIEPTR